MARKRTAAAPKPETKPAPKHDLLLAFDDGRLARINRQSIDACPYSIEEQTWKEWEKGWTAQRQAECEPTALLHVLNECGISATLGDLELLTFAQKVLIVDWCDHVPLDDASDMAFRTEAPPFVKYTGKTSKARGDLPAYKLIKFVFPEGPDAELPDESDESNEPDAALPPLTPIPPDNSEEAELRQLMTDFDNVGVSIDETQWRQLSDEEQKQASVWVKYRLQNSQSPVPTCLMKFATDTLKNEYVDYDAKQQIARQERFAVTFDKPSVVAPGEDDEGKIKVMAKATFATLSGGLADRLFRYKRCKIQFSTRKPDQWDQQELVDENPIYQTVSDVSGYKASRHETTFGFLVDQETLSVQAAFKELWGFTGSVIVEVLGDATGKPKKPDSGKGPGSPDRPIDRTLAAVGTDGIGRRHPAATAVLVRRTVHGQIARRSPRRRGSRTSHPGRSTMKLTLPLPPSVNDYWQHRVMTRRHGQPCRPFISTFISAAGRLFRERCQALIRELYPNHEDSSVLRKARLSVRIEMCHDRQGINDCDNRVKPLLDALKWDPRQLVGLFDDDSQVDALFVKRGRVIPTRSHMDRKTGKRIIDFIGGQCEIRIAVIATANRQRQLFEKEGIRNDN